MAPFPLAVLLLASSAPASADNALNWDEATVNASYNTVKEANESGLGKSVDIRVWVVEGSAGTAQRLGFHLMRANALFNNVEKDAVNVGVRFRFVGPARGITLPKEYLDMAAHGREAIKGDSYYGKPSALSKAELRIFELMKTTLSGEINLVYVVGLGGGRGWTYQAKFLPKNNTSAELGGKSPEDIAKAYKNTILLSDTVGMDTLAHELGHLLTNTGHVPDCDAESAKADPEGCAAIKQNLMLADGAYGDRLTENQKRAIGAFIRRKKLDR